MSSTPSVSPVPRVVDDVVASVRALASDGSDASSVEAMVAALRAADALTAFAVDVIARLAPHGGIERAAGVPVELLLTLAARRLGWEARKLTQTAATLRAMPQTAAAFTAGRLAAGEVGAISAEVRWLDAEGRAQVDRLVGEAVSGEEPLAADALLEQVQDAVARLRDDLLVAREDRAIDRSYLRLQPRLDGLGGSFSGEADTEGFATLCETVDLFAPPPIEDDEPDSRARQRLDGLLNACEAALSGGGSSRPRARFTIAVDARDPGAAARVLWRARGTGRLSPVARETLACDADIQLIGFQEGRPITVGEIIASVSAKARAALVARDGGCRFPGCDMPAAWAETHHVNGRGPQATRSIDDLVLLCRRCHRRVHRHKWKITVHADASVSFRLRGTIYVSQPKTQTRIPARE